MTNSEMSAFDTQEKWNRCLLEIVRGQQIIAKALIHFQEAVNENVHDTWENVHGGDNESITQQ